MQSRLCESPGNQQTVGTQASLTKKATDGEEVYSWKMMVLNFQDTGTLISYMEWGVLSSMTELCLKVYYEMEKPMENVSKNGLMALSMMENMRTIINVVLEYKNGHLVPVTKENGKTTSSMEKEFLISLMGQYIKEHTSLTKNMEVEFM